MALPGASLKRSVMTMSITLVVTIVVLFASCSAPAASGIDARAFPSSEQFPNHASVTTGPNGIRTLEASGSRADSGAGSGEVLVPPSLSSNRVRRSDSSAQTFFVVNDPGM